MPQRPFLDHSHNCVESLYKAQPCFTIHFYECLVGTTASVICRLEDADYEGHSLAMLNRIAAALNKKVVIDFVDRSKGKKAA